MPRQDKQPLISRIPVEEINAILEQHDSLILLLAQRHIPRSTIVADVDLEIDDLAENIRVRLWQALQKREIYNVRSYLRTIARNESINLLRGQEPTVRLLMNEDGELSQSGVVVTSSQEVYDPAEKIEEEEMLESYSSNLPEHVIKLPPLQQRAIISELKDRVADLLPLVDMFQRHEMNIENVAWPEAENELRSSRVLLSVARKKLRTTMKVEEW